MFTGVGKHLECTVLLALPIQGILYLKLQLLLNCILGCHLLYVHLFYTSDSIYSWLFQSHFLLITCVWLLEHLRFTMCQKFVSLDFCTYDFSSMPTMLRFRNWPKFSFGYGSNTGHEGVLVVAVIKQSSFCLPSFTAETASLSFSIVLVTVVTEKCGFGRSLLRFVLG